jgi:hypothetical protein
MGEQQVLRTRSGALSLSAKLYDVEDATSASESWTETYATAEIVGYNGTPRVKVGREWLLRQK